MPEQLVLTTAEVAACLAVSEDAALRIMKTTPGVLRLGHTENKHKRRYFAVSVPERIVRAQHALLTKAVS
jgi:hypothetical protein